MGELLDEFKMFSRRHVYENPDGVDDMTAFLQELDAQGRLKPYSEEEWKELGKAKGLSDDQVAELIEQAATWIPKEPEGILEQEPSDWPATVSSPEDIEEAAVNACRNAGSDAENDAEYQRGWGEGLKLLRQDPKKAVAWEFNVYRQMKSPSWYDMGKADVIAEHRAGAGNNPLPGGSEGGHMATNPGGKFYSSKYKSALDGALYNLSLDGVDDEVGDSGDFGWFGLMTDITEGEVLDAAEAMGVDLSDKDVSRVDGKSAIVSEDSQGFIDVKYFGDKEEAEAAFEEIASESEEFYGDAEE